MDSVRRRVKVERCERPTSAAMRNGSMVVLRSSFAILASEGGMDSVGDVHQVYLRVTVLCCACSKGGCYGWTRRCGLGV